MLRNLILCILVLCLSLTACTSVPAEPPEPQPPETAAATEERQTAPVTEAPEPQPTEPETVTETSRATILAVGDVMMHVPIINSGYSAGGYAYDYIFAPVADYVSGADFAVANLETTLAGTDNGDIYSGFPKFNAPDALADALKNTGFDLLLTANNHSYDTGAYGLNRTLEVLADRELLSLGTKPDDQENPWLIQEINSIRVGMVCYTYGEISDTGRKSVNGLPLQQALNDNINIFDYDKLDLFYDELGRHITDMKTLGAEAIVLFIHWGNEYHTSQSSIQTAMVQKLCNLGVDVIVGSHPHVIQGMEILTSETDSAHTTLCAYSLGNALSNQRAEKMDLDTGHTEDGIMLNFTFAKYSDGQVYLDTAGILPTWVHVHYGNTGRTYRVLPLDKEIGSWKDAFSIGSDDQRAAQSSYDRTMALLATDLKFIEEKLEDLRDSRNAGYGIFAGGVG